MTTYTVRLTARDEVAEGTVAFHFDKPAGFIFKPGQAIDLIVPQQGVANDSSQARHTFSIATAPFENKLVIATRMRDSAFKRALGALVIGAEVQIEGPFGTLTLHKNMERAGVFIAGGIGITPFMSIVRNAVEQGMPQALTLIYTNRRPEDAAFLAQLQQWARENPAFRLVATMTQMDRSSQAWHGLASPVNGDLVKSVIETLSSPIFYVSGPPAMVQAMHATLADAGIDEDDVRSEEFYGY
ncbi:FAD-dependent oxidoreductase [Allopusillimonas soli]|uniref:FAD-dependent oxidoreductase n=1 Tax=Allopusillimonas soli TaxID=659016 RepID=A0A853F9S2_9BURK|nr:FAD-dependent oxidoreductase [Allopusillimonas soli]NYT36843.1 FAD-dependent oxidoreductase [Allopusillimonas soli]TEA75303.1 FAD-dependent oxidoreductase [Allopusillimonas soli]